AEEVGDLLWYVANVATKFDLDLAEVAEQNLAKCEGRWGGLPNREPFDAGFPDGERFPRLVRQEVVRSEAPELDCPGASALEVPPPSGPPPEVLADRGAAPGRLAAATNRA